MRIKRFEAPDTTTALQMVKAELGEDAVILDTTRKRTKDPETGRVRTVMEVTAAIDPGGLSDSNTYPRSSRSPWARPVSFSEGEPPSLPLDVFCRLGLGAAVGKRLASLFELSVGVDSRTTPAMVHAWLVRYGLSRIRTVPDLACSPNAARLAVIGPTGSGKTTTLAKIAARLKYGAGRNGVLVCMDGYRIGAEAQLRTYAEYMDIAFEAPRNHGELSRVFSRHKDDGFILVDTPGRSLWDPRARDELAGLFQAVPALDAMAVLPAVMKSEDLENVVSFYAQFPVSGWIISKVDETRSTGPLFPPVVEKGLPISYVTTGQRVPEEIEPATPQGLVRLLLSPPQTLYRKRADAQMAATTHPLRKTDYEAINAMRTS
ncbi:MAG: hypothetical protein K6360_02885 [Deltaproteobacteria bacterium]